MLEPKPQENLREVVRRAFEEMARRDPGELAECAGGRARGRVIDIRLLGRTLAVDLEAREVRLLVEGAGAGAVGDNVAAVVARYVVLSGKLPRVRWGQGPEIGFADFTDARGYLAPFRGRVIAPLLRKFGRDPDAFARAAEGLGAERVDIEAAAAVAYRLPVLPRVALVFVLHPGDEEFPPEGQVLFPRGVFEAFAVDDVVAIAEIAGRALRGGLWPA